MADKLYTPKGYERWDHSIWKFDGRKKNQIAELPFEEPDEEEPLSEERKEVMVQVYDGRLNVKRVAKDLATEEFWIQLEEKGVVKPTWIPKEICASNILLSRESRLGFSFPSHNCHRVVQFILDSSKRRSVLSLSTRQGAIKTEGGWGWLLGQKWIGPSGTMVYPSPTSGNYGKAITSSGDLGDWVSVLADLSGNYGPVCRWLTFTPFAAPLLRWINYRTFIVHHWGAGGGGKSAIMDFGATAFGRAKDEGMSPKMVGSFNTTEMALVEQFREVDDLPVNVDELQSAKFRDHGKSIVNIIMQIVLGQSRQRLNNKGRISAPQVYWRSVVRFTGEQPLLGNSSMDLGGASSRIIQLRADAMPAREAKKLHQWMEQKRVYGVAGEAFIRALLPTVNDEDKLHQLRSLASELHERIEKGAGTDDRRLAHFAAVATAQALASRVLFRTPLDAAKNRAVNDALDIIQMADMSASVDDYHERAWDFLNQHLSAEPSKYLDLSDDTQANQLEQGRHHEIVGVLNRTPKEQRWYIPSKVNAILRREGFNPDRFWDDARRKKCIGTTKSGNVMPERNFGRFRARVYVVTNPGGTK